MDRPIIEITAVQFFTEKKKYHNSRKPKETTPPQPQIKDTSDVFGRKIGDKKY